MQLYNMTKMWGEFFLNFHPTKSALFMEFSLLLSVLLNLIPKSHFSTSDCRDQTGLDCSQQCLDFLMWYLCLKIQSYILTELQLPKLIRTTNTWKERKPSTNNKKIIMSTQRNCSEICIYQLNFFRSMAAQCHLRKL